MDAESEKMHLQSLEEYVLDEEKIVTYCWLSKVLNIHVNLAKELLSKFMSDPTHKSSVFVTYLISGKLKDGTYCVLVTDQNELNEAKSDFDVITSHHVYSIHKKKEAPSASLLYMVDSEKVENEIDVSKQIGAIKCTASVQRAADEMASLRLQSLPKPVASNSVVPTKKATSTTASATIETEKKDEASTSSKNNETATWSKNSDSKSKATTGGIAAMFAAQTAKPPKPSHSSSAAKAKSAPKKAGGINSFFSKVPKPESPPSISPPKRENKSEKVEKKSDDTPEDIDMTTEETELKSEPKSSVKETKVISPPVSDKVGKEKASSSKTNGKANKSKSKTKATSKKEKQRKRIKVIDSDSSDDMFGEERESSPEPDTRTSPPPPPPPSRKIIDSDDEVIPDTPQPQVEQKNQRKRKVVKDKTYVDDDGFIVTEKVTVYESCSDDETEAKEPMKKLREESVSNTTKENVKPAPVKESKTKPVKKTVSPVKNKQASLTSFFKKM